MQHDRLTLAELGTIREWLDGIMYIAPNDGSLDPTLISKLYDYLGDVEDRLQRF